MSGAVMDEVRRFVVDDLERARALGVDDPLFMLERAAKFDFGYLYHRPGGVSARFKTSFYTYKAFIEPVVREELERCLALFDENPGHHRTLGLELLGFARTRASPDYTLMLELAEREVYGAFDAILEDARRLLSLKVDVGFEEHALRAVASAHALPGHREQVEAFFKGAYDAVRARAGFTGESGMYIEDAAAGDADPPGAAEAGRELVNDDLFPAITRAVLTLPPEVRQRLWPVVCRGFAFICHEDRHYSARQSAALMALLMTCFGQPMPGAALRHLIEDVGWPYPEADWYGTACYARDISAADAAPAMALLSGDEGAKGRCDHAATLLADLDHKAAVALVERHLHETDDPEHREAFKEALARLHTQSGPPALEERMVWMFGAVTPTQRALGQQGGNVFEERAWGGDEADEESDQT